VIKKQKAAFVILACDASENTAKMIKNSCSYYNVQFYVCDLSMQELSDGIGKKGLCAVVGIRKHDILNLILSVIKA